MSDNNNSARDVLKLSDPEALMRENASLRERLQKIETEQSNVVDGGFKGEAPQYRINHPGVYLDDTHWVEGMVIDYVGVPNTSMVPMNEPARRAMEDYLAHLDYGARKLAALRGRDYYGLQTESGSLLEQALTDARKMATEGPVASTPMPTVIDDVPPMPHTDEAKARMARRGPGRPPKVLSSQAPVQGVDRGAPKLAPAPSDSSAVLGRFVR